MQVVMITLVLHTERIYRKSLPVIDRLPRCVEDMRFYMSLSKPTVDMQFLNCTTFRGFFHHSHLCRKFCAVSCLPGLRSLLSSGKMCRQLVALTTREADCKIYEIKRKPTEHFQTAKCGSHVNPQSSIRYLSLSFPSQELN